MRLTSEDLELTASGTLGRVSDLIPALDAFIFVAVIPVLWKPALLPWLAVLPLEARVVTLLLLAGVLELFVLLEPELGREVDLPVLTREEDALEGLGAERFGAVCLDEVLLEEGVLDFLGAARLFALPLLPLEPDWEPRAEPDLPDFEEPPFLLCAQQSDRMRPNPSKRTMHHIFRLPMTGSP